MDFALAAFALAPGLAFGSFLNVVAARVPLRRSLVSPGSACMSCGHEIGWRDNIPVLSWLLLRGRCRDCEAVIPWRYPAVELVSARATLANPCRRSDVDAVAVDEPRHAVTELLAELGGVGWSVTGLLGPSRNNGPI